MPHVHVDARLGPERNPRQGFGAQDILRWTDSWRRLRAEFKAARQPVMRPQPVKEGPLAPTLHSSGGMDEFFGPAPESANSR